MDFRVSTTLFQELMREVINKIACLGSRCVTFSLHHHHFIHTSFLTVQHPFQFMIPSRSLTDASIQESLWMTAHVSDSLVLHSLVITSKSCTHFSVLKICLTTSARWALVKKSLWLSLARSHASQIEKTHVFLPLISTDAHRFAAL
jgi:hypothetical protein